MDTVRVTLSLEFIMMPVVWPGEYLDSTAWMATYMAEVLKVSNVIWVIFLLLALGLGGPRSAAPGAPAARCRRCGARSSPLSSQLPMMPCSMGYFRVRMPLSLWASPPT